VGGAAVGGDRPPDSSRGRASWTSDHHHTLTEHTFGYNSNSRNVPFNIAGASGSSIDGRHRLEALRTFWGVTRHLTVLLAVDEATHSLTDDDRHFAIALERLGARVEAVLWGQDVPAESVVVIRSTWDYIERPALFAQWLDRLEAVGATVHNAIPVLRWNMHKRYLVELAGRGVPTVPTQLVTVGEHVDLSSLRAELGWAAIVVKPAVGGTARLAEHSRRVGPAGLQRHLDRVVRSEDALVQPFVESIATAGEISVIAIAGEPRLAIRKTPAPGDWRTQTDFGGTATAVPITAPLEDIAARALGALATTPAYARIDVTGDPTDHRLVELELVEPELFFRFDTTVADRLAQHVLEYAT
jgi:glutathione synthase/RimK-type ligase-like ATP-grasp enzyme